MQQTDLAFVTPPAPKPKARFMNIGPQLAWGRRVLAMLRNKKLENPWKKHDNIPL